MKSEQLFPAQWAVLDLVAVISEHLTCMAINTVQDPPTTINQAIDWFNSDFKKTTHCLLYVAEHTTDQAALASLIDKLAAQLEDKRTALSDIEYLQHLPRLVTDLRIRIDDIFGPTSKGEQHGKCHDYRTVSSRCYSA